MLAYEVLGFSMTPDHVCAMTLYSCALPTIPFLMLPFFPSEPPVSLLHVVHHSISYYTKIPSPLRCLSSFMSYGYTYKCTQIEDKSF